MKRECTIFTQGHDICLVLLRERTDLIDKAK